MTLLYSEGTFGNATITPGSNMSVTWTMTCQGCASNVPANPFTALAHIVVFLGNFINAYSFYLGIFAVLTLFFIIRTGVFIIRTGPSSPSNEVDEELDFTKWPEDQEAPKATLKPTCPYCNCIYSGSETMCTHCGAPRRLS